MASNNIARLGVVLGLDTAEFTASIDKAIGENRKLGQAIKRESNAAAGEIVALKNATDDYGKTLTKVQTIERDISTGRFRLASDDLKTQLMAQAVAYDAVAAAAAKQAKIADDAKLMAQQEQLAVQQIKALQFATEDYGQTLTKVAALRRDMESGGRFAGFSDENKAKLLEQAAAYDKVAAAAKHQADVVAAAANTQRQNQAGLAELQSLKNATEDYGKTLTKVQIIEREIQSGRLQGAGVDVKAQLLAQAAAYDKVAASAHKAAGGLTAWQKQGLAYQTTDFFTQIASGQSIIIAAIQQGGQLKDQMGGLGNMFRVLTPLVLSPTGAMVAFAAALGIAATAAVMGRREFDALNNSLILTGQYSGVTTDSFATMAKTISSTSRASIGDAKDILNGMISSGQFTNQAFDVVSKTIQRFSELSGLAAKDAAAKLIPMLDGTASSAKKLNDQYNFLTLEQYKQIEALAKQGRTQEAIILTSNLLLGSFDKTRNELGNLDRALDFTKKKWSEFWDAAMNWGKPDSPANQLAAVQKEINERAVLSGPPNIEFYTGDKTKYMAAWEARGDDLRKQKDQLVADIVKAREDARKLDGEKPKIIKYIAGKGEAEQAAEHKLKLEQRLEDAKTALRFTKERDRADAEQKIAVDSQERLQKLADEYNRDIAGKDKDYVSLRHEIYMEERKKEAEETERLVAAFREKARIAELTAYENARLERQKIDDEEAEEKLKRLMEYTDAYAKESQSSSAEKDRLEVQIKSVGLSERQVKLAELEAQYKRDIAENEKQYGDNPEALAAFNAMAEAKKKDGELTLEMADKLKYLQATNDAVWNNIGSAIDELTTKGETSFSKMTESILKDLLKIEIKKQALAMWDMIGGGKGLLGFFGKSATPAPVVDMAFTPVPGFAAGGDPPVGVPSMVGERGPELFVPRTAGTIVPNHMLGNSQAGPTINYNGPYIASMSAIDTQSGLQFLAKNKQSVWAAYQSANRSVPMSR
jgi:phage-related minor tail protein